MIKKCCICNSSVEENNTDKVIRFSDGNLYCKKHYLQMYRHGKILERTIYDSNNYILHDTFAECICYDKSGNEKGRIKVDLDKVKILQEYKIYIRGHNNKFYATLSIDGKKIMLHRYLFNLTNEEYSINKVVDHINGDSLDNRIDNLRVCKHSENMQNIHKKSRVGVNYNKSSKTNKWVARIMKNYKSINIGNFSSYEEALFARLKKEKELFGEFGPNQDLFYVLDHSEPINKLKEVLNSEV